MTSVSSYPVPLRTSNQLLHQLLGYSSWVDLWKSVNYIFVSLDTGIICRVLRCLRQIVGIASSHLPAQTHCRLGVPNPQAVD